MAETAEISVLKRKAGAGQPHTAHPVPAPQKAMRLALARAARAAIGLDVAVRGMEEARRSLAELLDMPPERALLAVLEGPEEGLGLLALSPDLLGAVIEVQTTGRIAAGERPTRRPTRTDAAMSVELIDRLLSELEAELEEAPDLVWAGGFRYASFLDDPRPLGLLLEDVAYRVFRVALDLGAGAGQGEIVVALPADGRGHAPEPCHAGPTDSGATRAWSAALEGAVLGAPAQLTAVLHRMRVPLTAAMGLKPGDLIPVPVTALERIVLEGLDGRKLGEGRLGQNRGHRAVRLTQVPQQGRAAPTACGPRAMEPGTEPGMEPGMEPDGWSRPASSPARWTPSRWRRRCRNRRR